MEARAARPRDLRIELHAGDAGWTPGPDTLAAFAFGGISQPGDDPRLIDVGLVTGDGRSAVESWRAPGPVTIAADGAIRYAAHQDYLFGRLEIEERADGGMPAAAEAAYRQIRRFQERQPQPHLLRIWNFLDAINEGAGDRERYRQFCIGRSRGFGDFPASRLPAATAVGRHRATGRLLVCWLAGRQSGRPVENPRQEHAYAYPRQYGPSPPAFARAMRLESGALMGSGTSSIVGHASRHDGDLAAQVEETLANLRELQRAGGGGGVTSAKVYLRQGAGDGSVAGRIRAGLPGLTNLLLLEADICRRELLVEIECVWGQARLSA